MATIEKRIDKEGKISYRAKIRIKNHSVQTATFEKLLDAKNWSQKTEVELKQGKYTTKKRNLKELIDKYIKEIIPRKKLKSQLTQAPQLIWWKAQIGNYSVPEITPSLLTECRNKLPNKSPATINSYCRTISHVFTIAVKEWGWMQENPMLKISKLKEPRGRSRFLSDVERKKLLKACQDSSCDVLYLLVVLALSTGARKMEILGLKWQDVDLERGLITLHDTKNVEVRALPLVSTAKSLMLEYFIDRNIETDLVFPGENINRPIDARTPFKIALKKVAITNFKWHDLRHSCASYLAMNGASLTEIAAVLGHKTLSMVKRYSHLSDAHTAGVVERMNSRIFGGGVRNNLLIFMSWIIKN